jgi:hypothetical protein
MLIAAISFGPSRSGGRDDRHCSAASTGRSRSVTERSRRNARYQADSPEVQTFYRV